MPGSPPLDVLEALLLDEASRRSPGGLAALVLPPPDEEPPPAPPLVALLLAQRPELRRWLAAALPGGAGGGFAADPAGALAERVARALLALNQFLPLDAARRAALTAVHARALAGAAEALAVATTPAALAAALAPVAAGYRRDLAAFVAALAAAGGLSLREVVAAEYDPALQLRVLLGPDLDPTALPEPILDLGCGRSARLVAHLRGLGKDARGVDRDVEPGPHLVRGDWLDAPLPPGLGTVLSHLGFSLHFLHHHLRPAPAARAGDDPALRYARRYMAILGALRPGGVFAYAPGLPFLERHLDARFRVERSPVPTPAGAATPLPWYACRVARREA